MNVAAATARALYCWLSRGVRTPGFGHPIWDVGYAGRAERCPRKHRYNRIVVNHEYKFHHIKLKRFIRFIFPTNFGIRSWKKMQFFFFVFQSFWKTILTLFSVLKLSDSGLDFFFLFSVISNPMFFGAPSTLAWFFGTDCIWQCSLGFATLRVTLRGAR